MDEMWQRHKSFILQILVGGIVFLIALMVMRSMYGDSNDPSKIEKKNAEQKKALETKLATLHAPSPASIRRQQELADFADKQKAEVGRRVASIVSRDPKLSEADRERAYVAENLRIALANIGRPEDPALRTLFDSAPQVCLSTMGAQARAVLVGRAAQTGKEIDESLGISGGFPEDEIPEALHGLAVVTDLVSRCLAKSRIEKIQAIRISTHTRFAEENDVGFVAAVSVHIEIVGEPDDVVEVIRSLNAVDRKDQRMTVVESVDSIVPLSVDEDTVRASINVVGLRLKSETQAAEGR